MAKANSMVIRFFTLVMLLALVSVSACKKNNFSTLSSENSSENSTVTLAIVQPVAGEVQAFFRSLQSGSNIHDYTLRTAIRKLGGAVSAEVVHVLDYGGEFSSYRDNRYAGFRVGERVFVYQKDFRAGAAEKYWKPVSWFSMTLLEYNDRGSRATLDDKVRYFVKTKYIEPMAISGFMNAVNTADFIFHFIPAYGGVEQAINAETSGGAFVGVVSAVGDLATLGLGSKIRLVKAGAAGIVLTASTVRLGTAVQQAANGTATIGTGVDAFLATVEAGLASVTLVKLNLTSVGAIVRNADEAAVLSKQLNRSANDILTNGITRAELRKLGVETAEQLSEAVRGFVSSRVPAHLPANSYKMSQGIDEVATFVNAAGDSKVMTGIKTAEVDAAGVVRANPTARPLGEFLSEHGGNFPRGRLDILWILQDDGRLVVALEDINGIKLGHPTLAAYGKSLAPGEIPLARFGGEIRYKSGQWVLNKSSGRYSSVAGITADDLEQVARAIREFGLDIVVDFF